MKGFAASRIRGIALIAASLFVATPALAWEVAAGVPNLNISFYVSSWSGSWQWTTRDERVRASDVPGVSIPNIWTTQTWNASAGEWPQADIGDDAGVAFSRIYNDEVSNERWTSAEAVVFGSVPPGTSGRAAGSGVAYDFDFVVFPFTTGTLFLDPDETYVRLSSSPGDVGNGFASIKLFRPDIPLNAPGGANAPLAQSAHTLAAGGTPIETNPTFSWNFQNPTGSAQTYHLRLEMSSAVVAVPEPAIAAGLAVGALGLAQLDRRARGRRRSRLG